MARAKLTLAVSVFQRALLSKPQLRIGRKFGRLKVLGPVFRAGAGCLVVCRCRCGKVTAPVKHSLLKGASTSCGCFQVEAVKKRLRTHGLSKTTFYCMWTMMKQRCVNPNVDSFKDYGARGIRVCKEWCDSFEEFRTWALANGYKPGLEIDRIDNDGNYEPGNCRWVRPVHNKRNKRSTVYLVAFGERKSISEWADDPRCKVAMKTLWKRLKDGWNPELAITKQSRGH